MNISVEEGGIFKQGLLFEAGYYQPFYITVIFFERERVHVSVFISTGG